MTIAPLAVDVPTAAEMLCLSDRSIITLCESGQLHSVKIGSSRRIPIEALKKIATQGATLPTVAQRNAKVAVKREAKATLAATA